MPGTASCGGATVSVCYSYDAENNRTQMMDGTGTTNYSYDAFGETTAVHNPTGPTTACDGGTNTTCYGYDSDGNTTSVTYPLPTSTVTNATWSSGTATITAANGFTSGQTVYVSGVNPSGYNGTFTVLASGLSSSQFEYSLGTNPGTYSSGGTATWWDTDAVGITYDAADQPTAVSDFSGSTSPYAISVAMNANGQITSTSLGSSGDTITPAYQNDGSVSSLALKKNSSGITLESFAYQYGPDGSDVSETDTDAGISGTVSCNGSTVTTCNSFDQGTRLGSATTSSNDQSYAADADSNSSALPELQGTTSQPAATYDGSDELISSTQSGTTTNYVYDGDGQLSSETQGSAITVTSVPDAAGNIIAYNDTNTTANTGANMSSATYNGDGLMTAESSTPAGGGGASEEFTYDLANGSSGLMEDSNYAFVYGPDGTIEQIGMGSGKPSYLLTDASGSVRGIVSTSNGADTAATTYDSYGNAQTPPVPSGGVEYSGLTAYTPIGPAGEYIDSTGSLVTPSSVTDPASGVNLNTPGHPCPAVSMIPSTVHKMCVFWGPNAVPNERGSPTSKGTCNTGSRGWIYTGSGNVAGGRAAPCYGFFYRQGDHWGPVKNCPLGPPPPGVYRCGGYYDKFAIDWQIAPRNRIYAQADGTVTYAGIAGNAGWGIAILYHNGIGAIYLHLSHNTISPKVRAGRPVVRGQPLAVSGESGATTGKYAGQVHVAWMSPAGFGVNLNGGWPNGSSTPIKQVPLFNYCLNTSNGPWVYVSIHGHDVVKGWNCPSGPVQ